MLVYEVITIFIMLLFNAIFAAYEMALASVSAAKLHLFLREGKKGAAEAVFMKDRIEASLAVIQLGITLVGAFAAAVGGAGMEERVSPYLAQSLKVPPFLAKLLAIIFFIIPLALVIIVFGELVPKMIAIKNKEWIVLKLSPYMKFLSNLANPVVSVIESIVKRSVGVISRLSPKTGTDRVQEFYDFKAAVSLARTAKLLGAQEEKIVLSSALFARRPVRDIVIPAQDIAMIWIESSLPEALVKAHLDMHTRFPVCRVPDDPQTIEGYVNFKDIVYALKASPSEPSLKSIVRSIKKINANTTISQTLEMMIKEKIHIAIVVSDDGRVLGMVTLEDVLEELVGDIEDEFDYLPAHIHPCGSAWIMGGGLPMTQVFATLGIDSSNKFSDSKTPTLSEWCMQKANRPLEGGEVIEADGIRAVVRKFRRKKVSEALVSLC